MATFLGRPLEELDDLYDVQGSQIRTQNIDLSGITLVHDVADGARSAASRRISLQAQSQATTNNGSNNLVMSMYATDSDGAGADIALSLSPWDSVISAGISPQDVDVWLYDWSVSYSAAGAVTAIRIAVRLDGTYPVGAVIPSKPLAYYGGGEFVMGTTRVRSVGTGSASRFDVSRRRVKLLYAESAARDDDLWSFFDGDGATAYDAFLTAQFVVCPKGAIPTVLQVP